jgi:pSer/pThr/pTyr-binding forkhead associated (FHA) protein
MKLVIEDEAGTRTVVPFTTDEIVVGRATEGIGWRLPDRNVSRRHARFTRSNGTVFVEDLGSLTGTRLNGEPVGSRRRVRPGDLVEIGAYDLVVLPEEMASSGPGTPPPLPSMTRPDPMPVVVVPPDESPARAAAAAPLAGSVAASAAGVGAGTVERRRTSLLRLGALALAGGLVLGLLLRRWLS